MEHVKTENCHADIATKNLGDQLHGVHSNAIHDGKFSYIESSEISGKEDVKSGTRLGSAGMQACRTSGEHVGQVGLREVKFDDGFGWTKVVHKRHPNRSKRVRGDCRTS